MISDENPESGAGIIYFFAGNEERLFFTLLELDLFLLLSPDFRLNYYLPINLWQNQKNNSYFCRNILGYLSFSPLSGRGCELYIYFNMMSISNLTLSCLICKDGII